MASAALRQYEHFLVLLHKEMKAGRPNGPEADSLRESMLGPWSGLTSAERDLTDLLSEDLYVVEEDVLPQPNLSAESAAEALESVKAIYAAGDLPLALEKLRAVSQRIDPSMKAFFMGRCWGRLGFPFAASCFFDYAYEHGRRANYAILALDALSSAGRYADAEQRAYAIEMQAEAEAPLVLKSATLLFQASARTSEHERAQMYRRVVSLVERGIGDESVLRSLRASALVAAGFSHEHLGDQTLALRAFDRAVVIHEYDATLLARAMSLLSTDRQNALRDFQRAVDLGTHLAWPYLYVAHAALTAERYALAESLADDGAARAKAGPLRAQFYEWGAIAAAMLDRPPRVVMQRFDLALSDDPERERIERNAEAFETALRSGQKASFSDQQIDDELARAKVEEAFLAA